MGDIPYIPLTTHIPTSRMPMRFLSCLSFLFFSFVLCLAYINNVVNAWIVIDFVALYIEDQCHFERKPVTHSNIRQNWGNFWPPERGKGLSFHRASTALTRFASAEASCSFNKEVSVRVEFFSTFACFIEECASTNSW